MFAKLKVFHLISIIFLYSSSFVVFGKLGEIKSPKFSKYYVESYKSLVDKSLDHKINLEIIKKLASKPYQKMVKKYPLKDIFKITRRNNVFYLSYNKLPIISFDYYQIPKGEINIFGDSFKLIKGEDPDTLVKRLTLFLDKKKSKKTSLFIKSLISSGYSDESLSAFTRFMNRTFSADSSDLAEVITIGSYGYVSTVFDEATGFFLDQKDFSDLLLKKLKEDLTTRDVSCKSATDRFNASKGETTEFKKLSDSNVGVFKSYFDDTEVDSNNFVFNYNDKDKSRIDHRKLISALLLKYKPINMNAFVRSKTKGVNTEESHFKAKSDKDRDMGGVFAEIKKQRAYTENIKRTLRGSHGQSEVSKFTENTRAKESAFLSKHEEYLVNTRNCSLFLDELTYKSSNDNEYDQSKKEICSIYDSLSSCMVNFVSVSNKAREHDRALDLDTTPLNLDNYEDSINKVKSQ